MMRPLKMLVGRILCVSKCLPPDSYWNVPYRITKHVRYEVMPLSTTPPTFSRVGKTTSRSLGLLTATVACTAPATATATDTATTFYM